MVELAFNSGKSRDEIVKQLESIDNTGGSTSAASGVRLAVSEMARSKRPNAKLLVLHISDGNSQVRNKYYVNAQHDLHRYAAPFY